MQVLPRNASSTANEIAEYQRPVTHKGTVTIPVEVRRLLGVQPRGQITFRVVSGERVELLPPLTLADTFGSVKPKTRPLDWKAVRASAIEEKVRRSVQAMNT